MTAFRGALSSARLSLIAAAVLVAACSGTPVAVASPTPSLVASPVASPTPTVVASPTPSESPTPAPAAPLVRCVRQESAGPEVLLGGAIYDVTDPVHPRLLCTILNTVAHLFTTDTFEYLRRTSPTGTEVVLHSIGSGNESVVAGWPLDLLDGPAPYAGAWTADGNSAATMVEGTDASGNQTIQVWLFAQPNKTELYEFPLPLTDCICRFGLPQPTLKFSADGQYLVAGWPIGKGAQPLRVYRLSDESLVKTFDNTDVEALWSHSGHILYLTSGRWWSPEGGVTTPSPATAWPYLAGLSPDGKEIAYTAFPDPSNQVNIRVYVYDLAANRTRMLVNQSRSQVTFVKDGWVWYTEEAPCADCPGQSAATTSVFAMNLADGVEVRVVFATGESVSGLQTGWGPGEFYPNT